MLKDKIVGHQSAYWNTMENAFSDICTFDAGHETAKGYSTAYFDGPRAPVINEVKNQVHASDMVGQIFRITSERANITPTRSSRTKRKLIIIPCSIKIIIKVVSTMSLQGPQ